MLTVARSSSRIGIEKVPPSKVAILFSLKCTSLLHQGHLDTTIHPSFDNASNSDINRSSRREPPATPLQTLTDY